MVRIAVLVSGGGTNLQMILDKAAAGKIPGGEVALVVSSRKTAYALERAKAAGVETAVLRRKDFASLEAFDDAMVALLREKRIDLVVLGGYLTIMGEGFIRAFAGRIMNVHPALIPSFCGKGYYGLRVHEEALARGVKVTGATVHFVNEITDGGPIIAQKAVAVMEGDTPEILQRRVMEEAEWILLPWAIAQFCQGRLHIEGNRVRIDAEKE